jgi:hypothetical protein
MALDSFLAMDELHFPRQSHSGSQPRRIYNNRAEARGYVMDEAASKQPQGLSAPPA